MSEPETSEPAERRFVRALIFGVSLGLVLGFVLNPFWLWFPISAVGGIFLVTLVGREDD